MKTTTQFVVDEPFVTQLQCYFGRCQINEQIEIWTKAIASPLIGH